ncbi:alpha/beta hydrolase [Aneurinibacillus thermoaerophilus]|uniref:alpha/beta fold hydrolase n=1 Tax=Aneurinibacillus thermoaerophilus TaxID=143495 RepID=UPI002E1A286C|nr:alpha/beta hydrolase [Aneurinibacillus thermoaerophilus]
MIYPLTIRNKKMHVEIFGEESSPPVLFLHGGPGESCYDFVYHQAKRLSKEFRLIAIDQRGVLRSEKILNDEPFVLQDLIDDCEELRFQLGIKEWTVIGHSFGGYLCLLYAITYPKSVSKVIFECPTFNFEWTSRNLLKRAALLFHEKGDKERAQECEALSVGSFSSKELFDHYLRISELLGDEKDRIYSPNPVVTDDSLYTDLEWEQFWEGTENHLEKLREEGSIFKSIIPYLSNLSVPSLLILGEFDPVTCEKHVQEYDQVTLGKKIVFNETGHTPHIEAPERYEEVVTTFIKSGLIEFE